LEEYHLLVERNPEELLHAPSGQNASWDLESVEVGCRDFQNQHQSNQYSGYGISYLDDSLDSDYRSGVMHVLDYSLDSDYRSRVMHVLKK
jgi:hypothetical protein